jgi:RNA-splicing ligase RtcB
MAATRFGPGGRAEQDRVPHPVLREDIWQNPFLQGLERHAAMHLADQGDGNHFAFLGEMSFSPSQETSLRHAGHDDLAERLAASARWQVLVTHHGSRGLGAHLFRRGQIAAAKHTAKVAAGMPAPACWLDAQSEEGAAYWQALQYVGRWTKANHQCIHARFAERLGTKTAAAVGNEHNFVWQRGHLFYHGKGATPAWRDDAGHPRLGLIPLHMAAPILLVLGKDNAGFLSFAPHGAGRNLSRRAALKPYRELDRQAIAKLVAEQTPGLEIRWWHGRPDLSETPLAYKSAGQVKAQILQFGLAEVIGEIEPRGCIMAGDPGPRNRAEELTPKQLRQIEHRADRRKARQKMQHWEDEES